MSEENKPKYNFSTPQAAPAPKPAAAPAPVPMEGTVAYRPAVNTAAPDDVEADKGHPGMLLVGVAASLAVGLLCGWLYALFVSVVHIGLAIITSGIGWLIGFVMVAVARRGGMLPASLSAVVALIALTFSRYQLVQFEVGSLIASGRLPESVRDAVASRPLEITIQSFGWNPLSIVILLIGVFGAFKLAYGGSSLSDS